MRAGPHWVLFGAAVLCLAASAALEHWAKRTSVWLSPEEWEAYLRERPGSRHATQPVMTPAGERAYRRAGRLFWLGLLFWTGWLALD